MYIPKLLKFTNFTMLSKINFAFCILHFEFSLSLPLI